MEHVSDEKAQYESDAISDEEDYDDYDDYYDEYADSEQTTKMHPVRERDIEKVKEAYGQNAISYRHLEAIGDMDV